MKNNSIIIKDHFRPDAKGKKHTEKDVYTKLKNVFHFSLAFFNCESSSL